ncbi:unnamed protein product [Urochloa humidicola]
MPSRRRRLTLAPGLLARVRPTEERIQKKEYTAEDCSKGRQALAAVVAIAAEASGKPKQQHGVEALAYKFWAADESDSDSSVDEEIEVVDEEDISTPEFIAQARCAGFSLADLEEAEKELSSSTSVSKQVNSDEQKAPLAR